MQFAQANAQTKNCKRACFANAPKTNQNDTNKHDRKEGRSANIGFAKWRVKCFYDSLVQGSSLVFQMNICAEKSATSQSREPLPVILKDIQHITTKNQIL